jgi:hypothetical protein
MSILTTGERNDTIRVPSDGLISCVLTAGGIDLTCAAVVWLYKPSPVVFSMRASA